MDYQGHNRREWFWITPLTVENKVVKDLNFINCFYDRVVFV